LGGFPNQLYFHDHAGSSFNFYRFRVDFNHSDLCSISCGTNAPQGRMGEKFNSAGAKLTYKEINRTKMQGRTVITYNLFATGLPKDQHYVLCVLNVGSEPRGVTDAYLNADGKVVNVLADPARGVPEDPIKR